tara:strand:+ start:539 stop:2434 length:1896 start_codon:yes stop_codon:yes gene_type:complete
MKLIKRFISRFRLDSLLIPTIDLFLIFFACQIGLRYRNFTFEGFKTDLKGFPDELSWILWIAPFLGVLIFYLSNQYRSLFGLFTTKNIYKLFSFSFFLLVILAIIGKIFFFKMPDTKAWILLYLIIVSVTSFSRFIYKDTFQKRIHYKSKNAKSIAIYGAGGAGRQLEAALKISNLFKVNFFIDNESSLWYREINGIKIYPPQVLKDKGKAIEQVFLAIPSLSNKRRIEILDSLQKYNLKISSIPSIDEITRSKSIIDTLKPINVEDLLERDAVIPYSHLLSRDVKAENICITGAGGSIGSELARQIIELNPRKLILLDNSESNLYQIISEINTISNPKIKIIPALGDCCNLNFLVDLFKKEDIKIIFHAAAYKHVPIVEINALNSIANNVFSTLNICIAAKEVNLKKVLMISSDKAVRPTNIMGATKRLSEIIVQAFAYEENKYSKNEEKTETCFSMVRFGNVLSSSGSAVPLFTKQIVSGGPVTLTHPKITRYFMTIKEAAQLVIQSASMAKGGEVFLLDMGKAIKIKDLVIKLIKLNGLQVKDDNNPNGDIEIKITGLRPGEKLYEELLIDAKTDKTDHPLIFRANEKFIPKKKLFPLLEDLKINISNRNTKDVFSILSKLVKEWEER